MVVDVGTGSGAWVVEVAQQFINARVYGTDISPVQPTLVPKNVDFIIADLVNGLTFDDCSTDLVNSRYCYTYSDYDWDRLLGGGIREKQWAPYVQEILRILKPGSGYAQFIELGYPFAFCTDGSLPADARLNKAQPSWTV
jgi:SAM-dependent methyltransferase